MTPPATASDEVIALRADGPVLHVTLNRPAARNAMSLAMVEALRQVLAGAETDGRTRVLVLRGAGGHFCAGADLKDMAAARMAPRALGEDPVAAVNARFGELCVAYASTPLAVVAVLEGTVMGGGFGLACVADVALAAPSASFRLPETALGVVPAQIAPFLVERLGYSQARRLAVTGGRLDAAEALTIGLVHAVHADDRLDAALAAVLRDIRACAPGAIAATKALMAKARFVPPADLVAEATAVFSRAAQGPEGLEGTTAFLQKRPPAWAQ
ncbi:enoyl-CoA hydratase-related protein [Ottowia sp.]|uniref:enoyl-CoA hydratase/isomerase family protein n=1 Tax=Ottowia sp. TaxID=1898956 RepID=UPI002B652DBF|nr:enoyl-CoA hydratase-related protein [Ottowia sp.]HRN76690.1 enoyl-CoA hydratase-related protein [Ottowia sp.]HRQ03778.1 enoyl-CoA hydratase-related protein [Ottowia sp.]